MDNKMLCQICYKDGLVVTYEIEQYIYLKISELNDSGIDNICVSKSIYSDDTFCANIIPKKIIFNGPATIVFWTDGTKTVVKQSKLDYYDYEKGFAMCVVKKVFGDQYAHIRKMVNKSFEDTLTLTIDEVRKCLLGELFGKGK